jgi:DNA-binding beta-propeller fold protein YncE
MSLFPNVSSQSRLLLVQAGAALVISALIGGCGNNYRPVVTPINPSGPAQQPIAYAVVVSSPAVGSPGVATVVDYSGDTIMVQAPIGPNPFAATVDSSGSNGYTVNSDGTLTNFQVGSQQPQEKDIHYSTLPASAQVVGLFSPLAGLWASDLNGNVIDVLAINGSAQAFKLAVPVAPTPVAVVGLGTIGQHVYSISQNVPYNVTCNTAPASVSQVGEADAIESSNYTVSARIPLGKCPVYGVMSPDGRRTFILNRGSDTITVINSQSNSLDQCTPFYNQNGQLVTCHPSLPLSTTAGLTGPNVPAIAGPVYAEYIPLTQQLVVANYDGGTVSVIDVSLDEYGNDSATFGTTFTIPLLNNNGTPTHPAAVTALADGSRAYTADQTDGTVHVLNLSSHTVVKVLNVSGHPRTVVSTSNSLYGKVYVVSPDSTFLTIIRTDQDIVDTTVLIEGNLIDVRTTNQNGTKGNANVTSRLPGGGQPCYIPGTEGSLATCQNIHP